MRLFLKILYYDLMIVAVGIVGVLFWRNRTLEALATLLVLVATTAMTIVDRSVAQRERRRELLRGLVHEVYMNLNLLTSRPFAPPTTPVTLPEVYPRAYVATLHAVSASGVFSDSRDRRLSLLLHDWLQRSQEINDRLAVTEARTFANPSETAAWKSRLVGGTILRKARSTLTALAAHLIDHYQVESGIDRDTVLFPRDAEEAFAAVPAEDLQSGTHGMGGHR